MSYGDARSRIQLLVDMLGMGEARGVCEETLPF